MSRLRHRFFPRRSAFARPRTLSVAVLGLLVANQLGVCAEPRPGSPNSSLFQSTPNKGDQSARPASPAQESPNSDEAKARDAKFQKLVTNMKFSGHFTVDGAEDQKLQKDEYVITVATKVGNGDLWALTSRIKYGDVDLNVPVPVQVKWAGDTPVITVDKVGIPGLGTFSARVVIDEGRYAGTWSHDEVGGHLFGTITPAGEAAGHKEASPAATTTPKSPPATP